MRLGLIIASSAFLAACAGGPMVKIKSSGPIDLAYVSNEQPTADRKTMKTNLMRDFKQDYYPYYLYVKVVPRTKSYVLASAQETTKELAFKEKWDDKKLEAQKAIAITNAKTSFEKETCMDVEIETDDLFANESTAWHGELISDGDQMQKLEVKFSKFVGWQNNKTTVYSSRYGANAVKDATYYLYSTACVSKAIDMTKPFELIVQPRYKQEVPEFRVSWGQTPNVAVVQ